jgi:hypothetical protein
MRMKKNLAAPSGSMFGLPTLSGLASRPLVAAARLSALASSYLYSYFFFYSYRRSFADRPGEASA